MPERPVALEDLLPICKECRHFHAQNEQSLTCDAYPSPYRIPWPILASVVNHRKPYPGDHGFRFEPADPEDMEERRRLPSWQSRSWRPMR